MAGVDERLRSLLARVSDHEVRAALERELEDLTARRRVGLLFERHLPEVVSLPNVRPRRGRFAKRRTGEGRVMVVARVRAGVATCVEQRGGDDTEEWQPEIVEVPVGELITIARFGDAIAPGLIRHETLGSAQSPDAPHHVLMNAENYHALQMLQWTHEGKVDLIYIDPPYNTGNKGWTYNDSYVGDADSFRHSKWLSFMERRLMLARRLLKSTGVIIVAIGDDEHHRLRMLLDQVFGDDNFISDVVWQGGRKNDSRYVSNGADYMLVYARSERALAEAGTRWREEKPGVAEAIENASRIWSASGGDHDNATRAWRAWLREFRRSGVPTDSVTRYTTLDASGRPIRTDGNISWPGGGGPRYDVLHPVTRQPVVVPKRGWRNPDPARMQAEIEAGRIYFGPDHTTQPGGITWLHELDTQVAESVFVRDRNSAAVGLEKRLGDRRFPNPKDHEVLMRWFRMVAPRDAVVLDFFGGSASTLEAVLRLNAEDEGTRECILVTNNELSAADDKRLRSEGHEPGDAAYEAQGVFHHVAVPRTRAVLSGLRPDGEGHGDAVDGCVEVVELAHLDAERVSDGKEFSALSPVLWLRAGATGDIIDAIGPQGWAATDEYAVLADVDAAETMLADLADTVRTLFVITNAPSELQQVAAIAPEGAEIVHLWDHYLTTFAEQRALA